MKKTALIALACATLAGCVTQPQEYGTVKLCDAYFYGSSHPRAAINAEVERRGINCEQYAGAVQAERARKDAAFNALSQNPLFQQRPAPQMMIQPSITCRSRDLGGVIQTQCN